MACGLFLDILILKTIYLIFFSFLCQTSYFYPEVSLKAVQMPK